MKSLFKMRQACNEWVLCSMYKRQSVLDEASRRRDKEGHAAATGLVWSIWWEALVNINRFSVIQALMHEEFTGSGNVGIKT